MTTVKLENIIDNLKINKFYINGLGLKCKLPSSEFDIYCIAKAILKRQIRKNKNVSRGI